MNADSLFSESDRQRIAQAVARAEERSRGEIVTVVVDASDDYDVTVWRAALFGALGGLVVALVVHLLGGFWGGDPLYWGAVPAFAGAASLFVLVGRIAALRRMLTPDDLLEHRVRQRAETAFLEHEVFDTRDRSGVLLFLSLFEHRVVVLGDVGINAVVEPGEWQAVVDTVVAAIRAGRPADGVVEAVERCGPLLDRAGLARRADDVDELPDAPRIES